MRRIPPFLGLASLLWLAWMTPVVPAQEPEKAQPAPAKKADAPFNPLGDTSRFTRLGGWGGFGGAMGQFGVGKAMLIMSPGVQAELKLTPEQKKDLAEWGGQMRKRGESMMRPPRGEQGQEEGPGPGGMNPLAMIETISSLVREGESGLAKILDKKQLARLNQVALQMEGVSALGRDDVAEAVNLDQGQREAIREILDDTKNHQVAFFIKQGLAIRGRRGGQVGDEAAPPARPDDPEAATPAKTAEPAEPAAEPEAVAKRRAVNRTLMQAEFTKMRDGTDQIQDAANARLLKILTKKQRARFDKLLGEPFDPAKMTGLASTPRPVDPEPAKVKEAPKPARSSRLKDSRFGADKEKPPER